MSLTLRDSIRGQRIDLVVGAKSLPVARGGGRRERGRVVRGHLARHGARQALVAQGGGDTRIWWASDGPGVSIAAAIEAWCLTPREDGEALPDRFVVVIPLDRRIYVAQVQEDAVVEEKALQPDLAESRVAEAIDGGTVVYAFTAGDAADGIGRQVQLEDPPFDLRAHRFAPAWRVFASQGIVHRTHLAAAALLLSTMAVGLNAGPVAVRHVSGLAGDLIERWWPQEMPLQVETEPPTVITPEVPHSAAWEMRAMARLLVQAEALYGDGLETLAWDGEGATFAGDSGESYPAAAHRLADAAGGAWSLDAGGWTIHLKPSRRPEPRPPGIGSEEALRTVLEMQAGYEFQSGPDLIEGQRNRRRNTITPDLRQLEFTLEFAGAAVGTLIEQAERLERRDELPAALTVAQCFFGPWRIDSCFLTLEVNTL